MTEAEARRLLGLPPRADAADVRRAYRRLARELHPDAGGDADRFRAVTRAVQVLERSTTDPIPEQQRSAAVDERWWDAAGAWHEDPVDTSGLDLARPVRDVPVQPVDVELLAALLARRAEDGVVQLRSRSPGSRLHRIIGWLQPDLLAALRVEQAVDGARAGHDLCVTLRASAGRGRRHLADASVPAGWTRSRGSESVTLERRLRPCREQAATAVRIARVVQADLEALAWPLEDWFLLRS